MTTRGMFSFLLPVLALVACNPSQSGKKDTPSGDDDCAPDVAGEQSLDNGFYGTSCSGNGLGGSNVDGVCGGPSAAPATALGSQ